jgi:hypothetical protein
MFLVPNGATLASVRSNWWQSYQGTGDNGREQPYNSIYPRVTVKSNTFTVHMRVQTLRKQSSASNTDWSLWREGIDNVTGEYRGSTTVERYVDLGDQRLPDFATNTDATLDNFYRFRVVQSRRFNP